MEFGCGVSGLNADLHVVMEAKIGNIVSLPPMKVVKSVGLETSTH